MITTCEVHLWRAATLPLGVTIRQAISNLETSGTQIVLVVSENNRLAGTLTDGDIRRALLTRRTLDSVIDDLIHRNPVVVPPEISRDLVLQLMQINKVRQIPIVNQEGSLVGLHLWNAIVAPKGIANMMVIMAGGKGTRLLPYTENCPKPMLEVGGKPILQHIIEKARKEGFQKFVISLHYLGHMVQEYFGNGDNYGVYIDYLREDSPLGTAGCLSLLPNTPELPFIVTNGDVLTNIHYNELLEYHSRNEVNATMAVRQYAIQNPFGVVRTKGVEIEAFEEKPVYHSQVNTGIYVVEPSALKHLTYNEYCDMPKLFERIKENSGKTIVYPIHETWLDIGKPEDLIKANFKLSG